MSQVQTKLTEAEFSTQVEELLNIFGWRWCHSRPARLKNGEWRTPISGSPGALDYMAVRGPELIFFELKSAHGRLRPEQAVWIEALRAAGQRVYLWRPSDSDWEEIAGVLKL